MIHLYRRQFQICLTFVNSEREELWSRLNRWHANIEKGITKEKYIEIEEKLGREPNLDRMPPDIEDFPYEVQMAIGTYNKLGDRFTSDFGYLGKDYTNLETYMSIYDIDDKEMFVETILRMDERVIKAFQEKMKKERSKLNKR